MNYQKQLWKTDMQLHTIIIICLFYQKFMISEKIKPFQTVIAGITIFLKRYFTLLWNKNHDLTLLHVFKTPE